MPDQKVLSQQPRLQMKATLPPLSDLNTRWRTLFRIDCNIGVDSELFSMFERVALDVTGVADIRILPDQQHTPHTIVALEYHSVTSELSAKFIAERFLGIVNARLNHPAASRQIFSALQAVKV